MMSFDPDPGQVNDLLIYVEYFDRANRMVLIDFIDSQAFGDFQTLMGLEKDSKMPSMILVREYKGRRIQQNTYYRIDKSTLENLFAENRIATYGLPGDSKRPDQTSYAIGFILNLGDNSDLFGKSEALFGQEKTFGNNIGDIKSIFSQWSNPKGNESLSAIVRDVGQGNWNELWKNDRLLLLFDCGAPYLASKAVVAEYIGNREEIIRARCPVLIISHWDLDHYHALLGMSEDTLSKFSFIVYRQPHQGKTCTMLHERISHLLPPANVLTLQAENRVTKDVPLTLISNPTENTLLFNGHFHKDRNRSGLVLAVRRPTSSVIFAADSHYYQISDYVLPHLEYHHSHHLVVPHHGGSAGKFKYDFKQLRPASAIISVGANSYNHPKDESVSSLTSLHFSVFQTRFKKTDIVITL